MISQETKTDFTVIVTGADGGPPDAAFAENIAAQSRKPSRVLFTSRDQISEKALEPFKAANIQVEIVQEDRPEICCRLNSAVNAVETPIVAFVDSGCRLAPDCFEHLVGCLERFAQHDVAITAGQVICPNPRPYTSMLSAIERLMRLRSRDPGGLIRSGYATPWDHGEEELGTEPFDIDCVSPGIVAVYREDCLANPFPEGYSLIASNWMEMFSLRITRRKRALFVPLAKTNPDAHPPVYSFADGSRKVHGAYWVHRQFARRSPLSVLHFLWATIWLTLISLVHPNRLGYAAGCVVGALRSLFFSRSLRKSVEKAAAHDNMDISFPRHLDFPMTSDPLETGHEKNAE